jgi:adenylate kinase family enzyme
MRRVLVLGPPGSGKSTLARRLGAIRGLPVFHLDQAYWRPGWVEAPPEAFRAAVERAASGPAWIIEGNYTSLALAPRLAAADTVIVLDVPSWLSLARVMRRTLRDRGLVRADMAAGCPERVDPAFLRFVWTWNRLRRARNLALFADFPGRLVVLRGAGAARRFLASEAGA